MSYLAFGVAHHPPDAHAPTLADQPRDDEPEGAADEHGGGRVAGDGARPCHTLARHGGTDEGDPLTEPGLPGDYIVAERNPDGSLLLAPDTSIEAIRGRLGGRPLTPEEFEEHFGDLSTDDEG